MTAKNNQKKEEQEQQSQQEEQTKQSPKRQIVIETDGNDIEITKSEVAGLIELKAILSTTLDAISRKSVEQSQNNE